MFYFLKAWVPSDQSSIILNGGGDSEGIGLGNGRLSFDYCCHYDVGKGVGCYLYGKSLENVMQEVLCGTE